MWIERERRVKGPDVGWNYVKRRIDSTLISLLNSRNGKGNILEIGVGKGDLVAKVCSQNESDVYTYIGLDLSVEGIRIACHKTDSRFHFLVAEATQLPFKPNQFDTVICSEVIEHIVEKEMLLGEICRVLKDSGILLLTTPNPKASRYLFLKIIRNIYLYKYRPHQPVENLISPEELTLVLGRYNFEILTHNRLITIPFTIDIMERYIKIPITPLRLIFEWLERRHFLSKRGLYQVISAIKREASVI